VKITSNPSATLTTNNCTNTSNTFFPQRDLIYAGMTAWDPTLSNLKLLEEGRYDPYLNSVEFWIGGSQDSRNKGFGNSYTISGILPDTYWFVTIHTKDWKQFLHHLFHHMQMFQQNSECTRLILSFDVELQSNVANYFFPGLQSYEFRFNCLYQIGIFETLIPQAKM